MPVIRLLQEFFMLEQPELKQDFLKLFNTIVPNLHRFDVFKDFITISAISLHNAVRFNQNLEDEYLTIIKSYSNEDLGSLAKLLGMLTHMLEPKPYDALGQVYMDLSFGDARKGQFFTPSHVCEFMAEITYGDKIKEDDFITLSEPACGGGGMILAFAHLLIKKGYNPANKLWVEAIDIDRTSALMCYIQLSLWNIPARVIVGNALTLEIKESFYTPAHYLYFWEAKLRKKMDDIKEEKASEIVKSDDSSTTTTSQTIQDEVIYPARAKKGIASGQLTLFGF
jgi:type I restriction-modification system DNA methylase subunit